MLPLFPSSLARISYGSHTLLLQGTLLTDGTVSALELVEGATCCAGEVGSYHTPGMKGDGNPVDRKNNYINQINQFWVIYPTNKISLRSLILSANGSGGKW